MQETIPRYAAKLIYVLSPAPVYSSLIFSILFLYFLLWKSGQLCFFLTHPLCQLASYGGQLLKLLIFFIWDHNYLPLKTRSKVRAKKKKNTDLKITVTWLKKKNHSLPSHYLYKETDTSAYKASELVIIRISTPTLFLVEMNYINSPQDLTLLP